MNNLNRRSRSAGRSCKERTYEHAGGDEAIHRLEDIFYDKCSEIPCFVRC